MKGWLQKLIAPSSPSVPRKSGQLPVQQRGGNLPAQPLQPQKTGPQANLPNATVIYGIGASFLFVSCLFLLKGGHWFPALVVFALAMCLVGFALHLLKHQD